MNRPTALHDLETNDGTERAPLFNKVNVPLLLSVVSFVFSVVALLMAIAAIVDVQVS